MSTFADFYNIAGDKCYELANHLGNVLVVINDKKIWSGTTGSFNADIVSYNDYDPFGMLLGDRKGVNGVGYRFGFQGQERDDEVKGEGNSLNYEFRMHDPRVGRFFAVDPLFKDYPWNSPYSFAEDDPVNYVDLEGAEKSPTPAQMTQVISSARKLSTVKGRDLLIFTTGVSESILNANSFGLYDAGKKIFSTPTIQKYETLRDRRLYTAGRIAGDLLAMIQSGDQMMAGGGIALTTGAETFGLEL